MDTILSFIVSLMRRQFKFVAVLCAGFTIVMLWAEGFTATNIAITVALTLVVGLFFVLVWFWTTVLQSMGSNKKPENRS